MTPLPRLRSAKGALVSKGQPYAPGGAFEPLASSRKCAGVLLFSVLYYKLGDSSPIITARIL